MSEPDCVDVEHSTESSESPLVSNRSTREHIYCLSFQAVALFGMAISIRSASSQLRYILASNFLIAIGMMALALSFTLFFCSRRLAKRFAPVCEQDFDDCSSLFLLTVFVRCAGIYFFLEFAISLGGIVAGVLASRKLSTQIQSANYVMMLLPFAARLLIACIAFFGAEKIASLLNRKTPLSTTPSTEETTALLLPRFCQVACAFFGVSLIIRAMSILLNTMRTSNRFPGMSNSIHSTHLVLFTVQVVIGVIFIVGHRRLYSLFMGLRRARVKVEDEEMA